MDRDKIHDGPSPRSPTTSLRLLETCWGMKTPSGRIVSCGIYADNAPGLEVRAGFSEEDLLKSRRTAEIGTAREIADDVEGGRHRKGLHGPHRNVAMR
jgi:hypothetical protein